MDGSADGEPIAQHRLEQKLVEVSSPHGGLDWVLSTITAILQQTGTVQTSLHVSCRSCGKPLHPLLSDGHRVADMESLHLWDRSAHPATHHCCCIVQVCS